MTPNTLLRVIVPLHPPDALVAGLHVKLPNYLMLAMNPTDKRAECPIDDGQYVVRNVDGVVAAFPLHGIELAPMTALVLVNADDAPAELALDVRNTDAYPVYDLPSPESMAEWREHLDAKYREHAGEYLTDTGK